MCIELFWVDLWLSCEEWVEVFLGVDLVVVYNEVRDEVWEELFELFVD